MKKELVKLFDKEINQAIAKDYQKLIGFLDATITQSFKLSGDERAEFLIKNLLNVRDFMSSEIIVEKTKISIKDTVISLFDSFVSDSDLDLEELAEIRRKKKEKELGAEQLQQENLLEIDQSTLLEEEEK